MADAFDTSQAQIEADRRAAVAAIAASGTAGAQALADANAQIASLRAQAMNGALASAAHRGVPTAAQAEVSGMIGRPFDMLSASTSQMAASAAQRQAALSGAAGTYFSQMSAAVPVARTAMQAAMARAAAKSSSSSGGDDELSDSELRLRLMGAGEGMKIDSLGKPRSSRDSGRQRRDLLRSALGELEGKIAQGRKRGDDLHELKDQIGATRAQLKAAKGDIRNAKETIVSRKETPAQVYARKAGIEAGLDPDLVRGLLPVPERREAAIKPQAKVLALSDAAQVAKLNPKQLARITRASGPDAAEGSWFERSENEAKSAISNGVPLATFRKNLEIHVPKKLRRTKALILAMYGPAFDR